MAGRCGCSGSSVCSCLIVAGENALVSGSGSSANPYRITPIYSGSGMPVSSMERYEANSSTILTTTQTLRLSSIVPREDLVSSGVRMYSGTTPAGATPTIVRIGLYSIDAAGNGTLVASTPNDTTLLSVSSTSYSKNWSTPVAVIAGNRYAVGLLVVTAATAPLMVGAAQANVMQTENIVLPWCAAALTGQANLPASFLYSALTTSVNSQYSRLF